MQVQKVVFVNMSQTLSLHWSLAQAYSKSTISAKLCVLESFQSYQTKIYSFLGLS